MQLTYCRRLSRWLTVAVTMLLVSMAGPAAATSDPLAAYKQAFAETSPHLRTAAAYLRTGNNDFAAIELDAFAEKWEGFKDGTDEMLVSIAEARRDAAIAIERMDAGKSDEARDILGRVRQRFRDMHRKAGLELFADCIFDADATAVPLWVNRRERPDLAQETERGRVIAEAQRFLSALEACNARAPAGIAADPEFRRLMDGSLASLARMPGAVNGMDDGLVYRLLIELRAFARLLMFRYG